MTGHTARLVQAFTQAAAAAESYTTVWQRIASTTSKPRFAITTCLRHFWGGIMLRLFNLVVVILSRRSA